MAAVLGWQPWQMNELRQDEFEAGLAYLKSREV